jgi:hypothetical protein
MLDELILAYYYRVGEDMVCGPIYRPLLRCAGRCSGAVQIGGGMTAGYLRAGGSSPRLDHLQPSASNQQEPLPTAVCHIPCLANRSQPDVVLCIFFFLSRKSRFTAHVYFLKLFSECFWPSSRDFHIRLAGRDEVLSDQQRDVVFVLWARCITPI